MMIKVNDLVAGRASAAASGAHYRHNSPLNWKLTLLYGGIIASVRLARTVLKGFGGGGVLPLFMPDGFKDIFKRLRFFFPHKIL